MTLLQSTKMQEVMKLMMTGGRDELEQAMRSDPESQEIVKTLDGVRSHEGYVTSSNSLVTSPVVRQE
jgi:hypothetical protein